MARQSMSQFKLVSRFRVAWGCSGEIGDGRTVAVFEQVVCTAVCLIMDEVAIPCCQPKVREGGIDGKDRVNVRSCPFRVALDQVGKVLAVDGTDGFSGFECGVEMAVEYLSKWRLKT